MARLRSLCLAIIGTAATAAAQTIEASNSSIANDNGAITLATSLGGEMVPRAHVIPLAGSNAPPGGLSGTIFLTNATSALYVTSRNIAAINCDEVPGELQADYSFNQAVSANASAVLFFSPTSETCTFMDYDGSYSWVYSMRQSEDSEMLLDAIDRGFDREQSLYGQIALSEEMGGGNGSEGFGGRDIGSNSPNGNDDEEDDSPLGPSPTTAVAMIILYAITGIITALFLVIIITGALRAHRHPERYGPRNVIGRPRQSRAKGIARAMLDTLPIVKFGQRNEETKPTDVELAEGGSENRQQSVDEQDATARGANEDAPDQQNDTARPADESAPRRQSTTEEGIAAAVSGGRRGSKTPNPDHLGCSICTEDFEEGQDQRVLPCDHRFHPDCVDPWLLNVSGTCPLCRIDLHPPAEEPELDENGNPVQRETDENGNPLPLDSEAGTAGAPPRMGVRRSLLIGLIGPRSVERMSQEERLSALRTMRARQLRREREANAANAEANVASEGQGQQAEQEDSSRIRGRLRRVLGVRTRRTEATARDQDEQQR